MYFKFNVARVNLILHVAVYRIAKFNRVLLKIREYLRLIPESE